MSQPCEVEEERSAPQRSAGDMGALALYLKEIQRIPVLTPAQERALAERIRNGERAALEELVRRNLRFVVAVARPYARHGVSLEDLINEGNIGLIRAAERFDVTRGFRFISYAVWWIRQCILLYLTEQSRTVRLPVSKVHILARLQRQSEQLTQQLGREPTTDELGKRLQIPAKQVEWLRTLPTTRFSLDEPAEGEESEFDIGTLTGGSGLSSEERLIETLRARDIRGSLAILDARGADIVRRYFGLEGHEPESLERIGKTYGLTRERVRQLRDRAIWKLRTSPETDLLADYAE
jgi:RNA polymerase primary sigma factor